MINVIYNDIKYAKRIHFYMASQLNMLLTEKHHVMNRIHRVMI